MSPASLPQPVTASLRRAVGPLHALVVNKYYFDEVYQAVFVRGTLWIGHALRGFDAIHLASALGLQAAANASVTFVAADHRLLRAAAQERLAIVNPEAPTG